MDNKMQFVKFNMRNKLLCKSIDISIFPKTIIFCK